MLRGPLVRLFLFLIVAAPAFHASAQAADPAPAATLGLPPSATRPGRDPNQPIDEEYTRKIREYTTEPFFLSPLVDYLPASATVPTPKAVLGDIAGARNNLPYSKEVYTYMRMLAKASPRVRVYSIGTSEEGREMIAVAVASESLFANLDKNKANLAKLADPRSINMDDAVAARIVTETTPVYYITGTIHSPESGAPTALMELAYRLAVDESPYIRNIRDHLITLITPIVEVDGRDRQVDLFRWRMAHPGETAPPLLYWGHYVAHDNNRDAMAMTLKLSENVMNTYIDWKAQVLHDLHESVPYLYDNTVGDGPYNAWLDPLLTNEWQMIGWNNVQEMTRLGMPGVFTHGNFDTWSPGYLMFMAATHNGISRLYETFGNGGTAETVERTLSPTETARTWYRQSPPLPKVKWSLRNNNNYEQTGLLVSLSYFANNRQQFLENFYEKSKRSILKARVEGPAAYILPADERRPGAQADLLRILQKQHVEISRATAPFTAMVPVPRPRTPPRDDVAPPRGAGPSPRPVDSARITDSAHVADGARPVDLPRVPDSLRRADSARTDTTRPPITPFDTLPLSVQRTAARQFPAGSYIIRMDQPYSRIADALLDYQYWSPSDPQRTPYDDTGWTFPENFAVRSVRVTDPRVLAVPMEVVTGEIKAPGGVIGSGSVFAINHNGDNALATLRYRLKDADFQIAEQPFDAAGQKFGRGSFIVRRISAGDLDKAARELGLKVYALNAAPSVPVHPARAPRVAIMHTWISTQTEGWWRQAFDFLHIPYSYISTQDAFRDPNLNAKYDVIIFPPGGGSPQSIVAGLPMWRNPMPWKKTELTPNMGIDETDDIRPGLGLRGVDNLSTFVKNGGVLVTVENTAEMAVTFGLASGVSLNQAGRLHVVGSLLRSKVIDDTSPIAYGIRDSLALYSDDGSSFSVTNVLGTRGGRFPDSAVSRPTGRGTADEVDVPQGRLPLDPRNDVARRRPVEPWQAAPVTDDQLRNPLAIIPPALRPRVILRFSDQRELLASGLLDGSDVAQRPVVVDVPLAKGHVILFANNPMYRGETIGSYFLVFNALLNFDRLDTGRKLDQR
ncbi:MAG TPA: M14 family zinc carboxypeptidase [Gemmatimonadaceae bacterium]|nr:M14 family zinc carboxypeptidase [Gemmatimonadaceae bacterium]